MSWYNKNYSLLKGNSELKILIISRVNWDESNSFGNTYSSFFKGMNDITIANIYCTYGLPNTQVATKFFCMNEKMILSNILDKTKPRGKEVVTTAEESLDKNYSGKLIQKTKTFKFQILYWIRDLIWSTNRWKSDELNNFIKEFDPDIIFSPYYSSIYMNNVKKYIYETTLVPMVSFVSDDIYTLKQFNLSPFYWINRFITRSKIRQTAILNKFIYVISEIQKEEYSKLLHKDCRMLYKGASFDEVPKKKRFDKPIIIVFTGNISSGRWKTLNELGKSIEKINQQEKKMKLLVYTKTPMTKRTKKLLNIKDSIELMQSVTSDEIEKVQLQADILLHCESFKLKHRLQVRLSFSTKLVDYFSRKRCILAIGSSKVTSIDYLIKNNAAITVSKKSEISSCLEDILRNPEIISEYAQKAWMCGKRNHQIKQIQQKLYNDLQSLIRVK